MIDPDRPIYLENDEFFERELTVMGTLDGFIKVELPPGAVACVCNDTSEDPYSLSYYLSNGRNTADPENGDALHWTKIVNGPFKTPLPSLSSIGLID